MREPHDYSLEPSKKLYTESVEKYEEIAVENSETPIWEGA